MNQGMNIFTVFSLLLILNGCSGTIFKKFNIDDDSPDSISIDARQRVILVTNKGGKYYKEKGGYRKVVCAEPSPDVMVAVAAASNVSASKGDVGVKSNNSFVENAANITQRSQTILLLRDALYRACESYMNGILDWREYKSIVYGYDDFVITMLAIDGLTQGSAAPTVVIGGEGSTSKDNGKKPAAGENNDQPVENSTQNSTKVSSGAKTEVHIKASYTISKDNAEVIREILKEYYNHQKWVLERLATVEDKN